MEAGLAADEFSIVAEGDAALGDYALGNLAYIQGELEGPQIGRVRFSQM